MSHQANGILPSKHDHDHDHDQDHDLDHDADHDRLQLEKEQFLNDELTQLREKLSIDVFHQYSKYPYYLYSALIVQRYVDHLTSLVSRSSSTSSLLLCQLSPLRNIGHITQLCVKFHYDHYSSLHQIAYTLWQTRGSLYVTETSDVFTGARLANHMKTHLSEYAFHHEQLMSVCRDLLKYKLLQRIAQSSSSNHAEFDELDKASKFNKYQFVFYGYYRFKPSRHREFVKLSQPDRDAWSRGTRVQVYSQSLGGWQNGTVLQINRNVLTVAYAARGTGKTRAVEQAHYNGPSQTMSIRKVMHRYDDDKIQSSDSFLVNRLKLELHSKLLVYSHAHRLWSEGQIVQVIELDDDDQMKRIFKVAYTVHDSVKAKYVHVWSSQIRLEDEVDEQFNRSEAESPYQKGTKVRVYSKSEQKWIDGVIEDTVPGYGLINVRYGHSEKLLEINSPHFRLPADVLVSTMRDHETQT
eukprot:CAMPEP_0197030348 /NCGR_PEP_ID=MMETSP1384-20130603/9598_1 /TAXON_ID=29189 /ORGANISM="Ammonia sp." /LENGTH=465 /DNA_ID=CAMNT_0042459675 /DNA_START=42 /DNA_END=1439 /DNA_ORIENTATION=+